MNATEALNRANDFVAGAEASFNAGALASCALCCYAAAFWAQITVLERLGTKQREWRHNELWRVLVWRQSKSGTFLAHRTQM
jgi:hypothetical protein